MCRSIKTLRNADILATDEEVRAAAVVSVGVDNTFGHPYGEVVDLLESHLAEYGLFLTKGPGEIAFTSDGESLRVSTSR